MKLLTTAYLIAASPFVANVQADERPNVLFIAIDDLNH